MGIIKVFTSQCCCEVKLDRIGPSFNLKVMQVEGAPRDGSYLQMMSLRLGCLESNPGPLTPAPRRSRLLPGSPMFLPSPLPPSPATPQPISWGVPGPRVHGPSPGSHPGAEAQGLGRGKHPPHLKPEGRGQTRGTAAATAVSSGNLSPDWRQHPLPEQLNPPARVAGSACSYWAAVPVGGQYPLFFFLWSPLAETAALSLADPS